MAILMGDLRAALVDAGASNELADKAATEVATYEARLAGVETRLLVLTWMAGANLVLVLLVLGSVFGLWTRLGALGGQVARLGH